MYYGDLYTTINLVKDDILKYSGASTSDKEDLEKSINLFFERVVDDILNSYIRPAIEIRIRGNGTEVENYFKILEKAMFHCMTAIDQMKSDSGL